MLKYYVFLIISFFRNSTEIHPNSSEDEESREDEVESDEEGLSDGESISSTEEEQNEKNVKKFDHSNVEGKNPYIDRILEVNIQTYNPK